MTRNGRSGHSAAIYYAARIDIEHFAMLDGFSYSGQKIAAPCFAKLRVTSRSWRLA
jgi:hypothetical protein